MLRLKTSFYCLLGLFLVTGGLRAQTGNRVFLFPSGGTSNVTVLDATTLAQVGTIDASPNAFQVLGAPDGSKYYIIANNAVRTVTVVNAANLTVTRRLDLGAPASAAVITPDGRRLLITAGTLRIHDTATDAELGRIPVGIGPTDLEVNNDSTRAYVMSTTSNQITEVNLTNNAATVIPVASPVSIALTPSVKNLLVLAAGGLRLVNPVNRSVSEPIPVPVGFGNVLVTPDSSKAVLVNRSPAPANISQIVDLTSRVVTPIGTGDTQGFNQIVIVDPTTAFGVVSGTNGVARIDLASGTVAVQSYGANTRAIEASPNGKNLYLASLAGSSVSRLDVAANLITGTQNVGAPPVGTSVVFPPPTANAAAMALNGGDRQNLIAGQTAPVPLSVRVTTSDGSPVFDVPVTFTSAVGVSITPVQPSRTNSRGIAQAIVSVAASSSLQAEPEGGLAAAALGAAGPVEQDLQTITVTASTGGAPAVNFTLLVGSTTGITAVSGSFQITRPTQPFPLPLVVRVTDLDGFPVPAGTAVIFTSTGQGVLCPGFPPATTDAEGVARAQCNGGSLPPGFNSFTTTVQVAVDGRPDLGSATFTLTTAFTLPSAPVVIQGDGQSGDAGTTLQLPLGVQLSGFDVVALLGVYWEVVSGPAGTSSASVSPAITLTDGSGRAFTTVTLGPRVGLDPVIIRAFVPGIPGEAIFTLRITGGPPERVTILQGDNQEGRPGTTLPLALRVAVTNLFGQRVPLPNDRFPLTFTVSPSGAATLSNLFQQFDGEASVLVTIAGNFTGPFTVTAAAGNGRAVFNLRATSLPAALVQIAGNNQRVGVGATTSDQLVVRVNDAQGNPVPGVPVTFSGPASVTLVTAQGASGNPVTINSGADGRASVSVRVGAGTALGNVTITAASSVGNVSFIVVVVGRTPLFTAAAIVNAASFVPGMVPGGLASLFGTGLSEVTGNEFPGGATSHRGVSVRIDGEAVPLFLVRNEGGQEQINFQVRTDLGVPAAVRIEVNNNGSVATVSNVPVLRVQPGIFEFVPSGGALRFAAAVKPDGSVISPANPVSRGGVFSLFLTGMGPTLPTLRTGQVGPVPPAETFLRPTVGLGGRGMEVLFSGVAPGLIINQVNVRVSDDAPVGSSVQLDVVVEGVPSQSSRISVQ